MRLGPRAPPPSPLTRARDLAELAVEEDPVVELPAPVLQVRVADQPADLREGGPERRAVHGHPAAPGTGALDDLDPAVLGGRSVALGEYRAHDLQVERIALELLGTARAASRRRASGVQARRRSIAPRRTGPARGPWRHRPASGSRCRVAVPGQVHRPDRAAVDRARPAGRPGVTCAPAVSGPSHSGGSPSGSVGPKREAAGLPAGRARRSRWRWPTRRRPSPRATVRAIADATPTRRRRGRSARPPADPAGQAEAREQARSDERQQPRVGGLERRHQGLRAERLELVDEPRRSTAAAAATTPTAERHHQRVRASTTGDRRPDDAAHRDRQRHEHRDRRRRCRAARPADRRAGRARRPGPTPRRGPYR